MRKNGNGEFGKFENWSKNRVFLEKLEISIEFFDFFGNFEKTGNLHRFFY